MFICLFVKLIYTFGNKERKNRPIFSIANKERAHKGPTQAGGKSSSWLTLQCVKYCQSEKSKDIHEASDTVLESDRARHPDKTI